MKKGFATLIVVIIVSAILLAVSVGSVLSLFTLRTERMQSRDKFQSRYFAETCLEYGFLHIIQDSHYSISSPEVISIPNGSCSITSITESGNSRIITATSVVSRSFTTFTATLDISDINNPTITNFQEI
ncbi:MAG: hypothetical protein NUV47_00380 [Patescibacteria group bacterium]|nr:hypothetical protein [Patescibacteria group bacterium]